MAAWLRLTALLLCAGVALLGVALAAETQREVFLEPDLDAAQQAAQGADSNLVILFAVPTALACAVGASLLSRQPATRRLGPAAGIVVGVYALVNLAQGAWPNYDAVLEARRADLANTLFVAQLDATPSILVPGLAAVAGALLLLRSCAARLLAPLAAPRGAAPDHLGMPSTLLRRHLAGLALAAPFLLMSALGTIRLLLAVPGDERGASPYLVLLPACILACLGLVAVALAKAWQLGVWMRNGRLAGSVQDAWLLLGRIEVGLAAGLAGLATLASLLAAIDLPDLHLGRTFSVTLRGHTQLLMFALVPLWPAVRLHRDVRRCLDGPPGHDPSVESGTHPLAIAALAATGLGAVLGGVATFASDGALWPWILTAAPLLALAAARADPSRAAVALLWGGFALWAVGNTIVADYDGAREGALRFQTAPGLLALWRTVAVLLGTLGLARALRPLARDGGTVAWLLAAAASVGAASLVLLEMPLWAWLTPRTGADALAVGSLLASLDPGVRAAIHVVAAVLVGGGTLALARLLRPDWFGARPPPLVAALRSKAKARTTA